VLAGAGLGRDDLIQVTFYALGDPALLLPAIDTAYAAFFSTVATPPTKV